jgi:hypothetical protein
LVAGSLAANSSRTSSSFASRPGDRQVGLSLPPSLPPITLRSAGLRRELELAIHETEIEALRERVVEATIQHDTLHARILDVERKELGIIRERMARKQQETLKRTSKREKGPIQPKSNTIVLRRTGKAARVAVPVIQIGAKIIPSRRTANVPVVPSIQQALERSLMDDSEPASVSSFDPTVPVSFPRLKPRSRRASFESKFSDSMYSVAISSLPTSSSASMRTDMPPLASLPFPSSIETHFSLLGPAVPVRIPTHQEQRILRHHVDQWKSLSVAKTLTWVSFPWPIFSKPTKPEDLVLEAEDIKMYLKFLQFFWKDGPLSESECIREYSRRWHPDRIEVTLGRVIERDKEAVRISAYEVAKVLGRIMTDRS